MFDGGNFPACIKQNISDDVRGLEGEWVEFDKPVQPIQQFLARLGVGAFKRNIVARYKCTMIIGVSEDHEMTSKDDSLDSIDGSTADSEEAVTRPSTPVSPSSDDSVDNDMNDSEEAVTLPSTPVSTSSDEAVLKWYQKQYFPLGVVKEATFVSDASSELEHNDPDTGHWISSTCVTEDGCLIQKRISKDLGLTMYDTRCIVKRPVNLQKLEEGELELIAESDDTYSSDKYQLFQWILIDHKNEDAIMTCTYHLKQKSK